MPYRLDWLVEDRVLLIESGSSVSAEELRQQGQEILAMLDSSSASQVHIVIDNTNARDMPNLFEFAKLSWPRHPKIGYRVVFGISNRALEFLTSIVSQVFKASYVSVKTLEDATAAVQAYDTTLQDPSLWRKIN